MSRSWALKFQLVTWPLLWSVSVYGRATPSVFWLFKVDEDVLSCEGLCSSFLINSETDIWLLDSPSWVIPTTSFSQCLPSYDVHKISKHLGKYQP